MALLYERYEARANIMWAGMMAHNNQFDVLFLLPNSQKMIVAAAATLRESTPSFIGIFAT